ncbi:hypothetical protein ABT040_16190 [Streptomyces sp. NPDC002688]|uniref:hypothetical protein n=1 Tax=Streptomyces sp. NPDC002688 TaxID=3154423 RepID=UPI00332020DD
MTGRFVLRRREDQLRLTFELRNLTVDTSVAGAPVLRRIAPGPAHLVVHFPAQHLAEAAGTGEDAVPPSIPVRTWVAGESRLAFAVPEAAEPLPFTEQALLRWGELALSVAPGARPPGDRPVPAPPLGEPSGEQTAIELPWRLLLSPPAGSRFRHPAGPVTRDGRTELWHTEYEGGTARALWHTDPGTPGDGPAGPPLNSRQRHELVRLTSDFTLPAPLPEPVRVERLRLSSLGGWLSAHGEWTPPPGLSVTGWENRVTAGRDQYASVTERGYLLPFGHRVTYTRITERIVRPARGGSPTAWLHVRQLLTVTDPERTYPSYGQPHGGRRFPFRRIVLGDRVVPGLDVPQPFVPSLGEGAFVPTVGGTAVSFAYTAEDMSGATVDLHCPAVFVRGDLAHRSGPMGLVRSVYQNVPDSDALRRVELPGRFLAFAPHDVPGDSGAQTHALVLAMDAPDSGTGEDALEQHLQPYCYPAVERARIRLTDLETLSGVPTPLVDAGWYPRYRDGGFGPRNLGEVILALEQPVSFALPGDRAGLMDPGMAVTGLSRRLGPVGGRLDTLADGLIDMRRILQDAPATPRLFGVVPLSELVEPVQVPAPGQPPEGALYLRATRAGLTGDRPPAGSDPLEDQRFAVKMVYEPKLTGDIAGLIVFHPQAYARIELALAHSDVRRGPVPDDFLCRVLILNQKLWAEPGKTPPIPLPGSGPYFDSTPALTVRLLGKPPNRFVEIDFIRLAFAAGTRRKPEVDVAVADVRFDGALKFVQKLADTFTGGGGAERTALAAPAKKSSPWKFRFVPGTQYLEVGISLGLPPLALGALLLKNMNLSGWARLPYSAITGGDLNPMRYGFALSERQSPFTIAVFAWGGGGYFGITMSLAGVELLEVALEFGYHAEFGIAAVATGSVEIMAGIYFRLERSPADNQRHIELTAYLRARGRLTILCIVDVSLELYLGLSYRAVAGGSGKLVGQAKVALTVSVLFFSVSLEASVERKISGDAADPSFLDQLPTRQLWNDYLSAFAPIGA